MNSIKNKKRTNHYSTTKHKKNKKYNKKTKKYYKKTKKYSRKNLKKRTNKRKSKKNIKRIKLQSRYRKHGGSPQNYYWSPMRKLEYNPEFDTTETNTSRNEIDTPAYNCRNPVTVVQTGGNIEVETECPYMAKGASSYALKSPPGLSNGLIEENNPSGGGLFKTKYSTPKVIKTVSLKKYVKIPPDILLSEYMRSRKKNKSKNMNQSTPSTSNPTPT